MIPQSYPLYARVWLGEDPTTVMTHAIIGWTPNPKLRDGHYLPITAPLPHNSPISGFAITTPAAGILNGEGHTRWRITTDPHDEWTPQPRPQASAGETDEADY